MSEAALKILLVEDNPADAQLIMRELRQAGIRAMVTCVDAELEYFAQLSSDLDAILCDYRLPQFDALRALELARGRCPEVPFFIISGSIGEDTAVHAIKEGATDYLLKDRLGRLGPAVRQALAQRQLRRSQQRAQEALRASEEQYRALAECIPQLVWMSNADGKVEYVNQRVLDYTGLPADAFAGMGGVQIVHSDDLRRMVETRSTAMGSEATASFEFRLRRADGSYRWHILRAAPIHDGEGRLIKWLGTCTDIHDQKETADRLTRDALLLANVQDSVIVTDLNGIVTYWNDGSMRLFGWTAQEMVGRLYVDRFAEPRRSRMMKRINEWAQGVEWQGEYEELRKDGSRVFIHGRVGRISDANGQLIGLLGVAYDITARRQAEAALRLRDRAIQAVSQGILITDPNQPDNPIIYASPSFERMTGYSPQEVRGTNCRFMQGKDTDPAVIASLRSAIKEGRAFSAELLNYRKDGTPFWNALDVTPVRDGERLTHFVGVQTDVTERRRLEEQSRQGQKMEAVGQLAGGVAHDFNNLLTVINGAADVLMSPLDEQSPQWEMLSAIREAGQRAASLTAQLLAFSRKTIVEPKVLDLNEVVDQIGKMLRRLLGEHIMLHTALAPRLHRVKVDPGQLDQVIMNLSINARDAMPAGGRLTIETRNVELGQTECHSDGDCRPGPYVRLQVTDTGCGMTDAVKARIFEPFFTTKEVGKGSGLGLATVYGIAKTYGGHVEVWSEVNRGTRITVLLPAVLDEKSPAVSAGPPAPDKGTETLLIVEDEPVVRQLMRISLELQGYRVFEARDGGEAIRLAERHVGPIDLLLTDVVMPGIGGRAAAQEILTRHPEARVLYLSGYTDDAVVRHGVVEARDAFLQKPFTPLTLARKVREVLDAPGSAAPTQRSSRG